MNKHADTSLQGWSGIGCDGDSTGQSHVTLHFCSFSSATDHLALDGDHNTSLGHDIPCAERQVSHEDVTSVQLGPGDNWIGIVMAP